MKKKQLRNKKTTSKPQKPVTVLKYKTKNALKSNQWNRMLRGENETSEYSFENTDSRNDSKKKYIYINPNEKYKQKNEISSK